MSSFHPDWLVPDWPAPASIRAVCTTRHGGVSQGAYATLNLGIHVQDDAAAAQSNRTILASALGVRPVFLNQVHGTQVLRMGAHASDGLTADAAVAADTGLACTVMVADCLPVLLCDAEGRQVAAAHAGWRGLLGHAGQGVLESTVAEMVVAPHKLLAWLGPCIGPRAFEVGDDVRDAFVANTPQAADCFRPGVAGKWFADLPGLARLRLAAIGIERLYGNDGSNAWCTVGNPLRFFSHRRDRVSGRQAACIWRVA